MMARILTARGKHAAKSWQTLMFWTWGFRLNFVRHSTNIANPKPSNKSSNSLQPIYEHFSALPCDYRGIEPVDAVQERWERTPTARGAERTFTPSRPDVLLTANAITCACSGEREGTFSSLSPPGLASFTRCGVADEKPPLLRVKFHLRLLPLLQQLGDGDNEVEYHHNSATLSRIAHRLL